MNLRLIPFAICIIACSRAPVLAQAMDKELTELAQKLATQIKDNSKKKVAVLDFTDLQGSGSELGRYIAEELTVNLVMNRKDFSVLDRANLKSVLAEHKLTATGLIDPDNAKKLGQFAGVDALIMGTIVPMNENIQLTAKIITTDTAEIVGAAKTLIKTNEIALKLMSTPAESKLGGPAQDMTNDATKLSKVFGDLRVDVKSLTVLSEKKFRLAMELVNKNQKKSVWIAFNTDFVSTLKGGITDANRSQFQSNSGEVTGVETAAYQQGGFFQATEIKPSESVSTTITFFSRAGAHASPGQCQVQLEFLVGNNFDGTFGTARVHNLVTKLEAN